MKDAPRARCRSCRYWDGDNANANALILARCIRHAPQVVETQDHGVWPLTAPNDVCGDHEHFRAVP